MRFLLFVCFFFICVDASAQNKPLFNTPNDAFNVKQQDDSKEGVQSFSNQDAWRDMIAEDVVLPEIPAFVGEVAVANITKAEQVFCYTVEKRPENYEGYTLNGYAVTGFCGVISDTLKKRIVTELFMTSENVLVDKDAKCTIQPKAIIRFIRGVDYTDVLISSPCYSYAIFYANKLKAFNAIPAQNFIKALVAAFEKKKTTFVSPTLNKQVFPVGRIQGENQQKIEEVKDVEKVKGWNNLSF